MNDIALYGRENLHQLTVPDNYDAVYAYDYLSPMISDGVDKYISNIRTELKILKIDDILLPVNINEREYSNSYTSSIYSHYVSYSAEELWELKNPFLEGLFRIILAFLGMCCRFCETDKTVYVNNWFLSTNLYPELTEEQYGRITEFLKKEYPHHAIVFRSLNDRQHERELGLLQRMGYRLLGSRQVYVFDKCKRSKLTGKRKNKLEKDIKLLQKGKYVLQDLNQEETLTAKKLYDMLYIEKYSALNPQFTAEFYGLCIRRKLMNFRTFRAGNEIMAVLGYYTRNGSMTTPIFGYRTDTSKDEGLYRIMSARLVLEAETNGCVLNNSSGASKFKMWRGAEPSIEYSAVCDDHLSAHRRAGYRLLEFIVNSIAVKLIRHYGL